MDTLELFVRLAQMGVVLDFRLVRTVQLGQFFVVAASFMLGQDVLMLERLLSVQG